MVSLFHNVSLISRAGLNVSQLSKFIRLENCPNLHQTTLEGNKVRDFIVIESNKQYFKRARDDEEVGGISYDFNLQDFDSEISETLGLGLDIQGLVSSGLGLENCSYPSLSLDHQEFLSLVLETDTYF